jgi:hypothetical protein
MLKGIGFFIRIILAFHYSCIKQLLNATLDILMDTHLKIIALFVLILFVSSFAQSSQGGSIQFRSKPEQVDVFSPHYGYIGTTPFTFILKDKIPAEALQTGVWNIGPFTASKKGSAPIIIYPTLEITKTIQEGSPTPSDVQPSWVYNFPFLCTNTISDIPQKPEVPTFFACNHWVDENQDGAVAPNEWVGIKEVFRPNENITFVAYIDKGIGVDFEYELRDPNNNRPNLDAKLPPASPNTPAASSETTKYEKSVIRVEFSVKDLIGCPTIENAPSSPAGDWKMYWKIQGSLVNITQVRLK